MRCPHGCGLRGFEWHTYTHKAPPYAVAATAAGVWLVQTRLVHVLYETLFDWFPPKDSSVKLVRPKQLVMYPLHLITPLQRVVPSLTPPSSSCVAHRLSDAEKVALKDSGLEHRQRMQLFKGAGMQLIKLFDECPGLVAPKLTVALALLSMLQHEIMWWLTHQGQTPRKVWQWVATGVLRDGASHTRTCTATAVHGRLVVSSASPLWASLTLQPFATRT